MRKTERAMAARIAGFERRAPFCGHGRGKGYDCMQRTRHDSGLCPWHRPDPKDALIVEMRAELAATKELLDRVEGAARNWHYASDAHGVQMQYHLGLAAVADDILALLAPTPPGEGGR